MGAEDSGGGYDSHVLNTHRDIDIGYVAQGKFYIFTTIRRFILCVK